MKKLITLVKTKGKTKEEFLKEIMAQLIEQDIVKEEEENEIDKKML